VEPAYDRDDLGVQHGLAGATAEEVTSRTK
jgi:hypothetical protein